jgi:hypothetical protein
MVLDDSLSHEGGQTSGRVYLFCGQLRRRCHDCKDGPEGNLPQRENRWVIVDLVGKGGHVRTVPVPAWVKTAIDQWMAVSKIRVGRLFRCVSKTGSVWGTGITEKVVWTVVREFARSASLSKLAPHDLRRTCARLCHEAGGELEQIQFLLGHVSVQTTEHYLGCKQRLREAVNDNIGPEPIGVTEGTSSNCPEEESSWSTAP